MKKIYRILGILGLFAFLLSCSKDDEVIPDMVSLVKDNAVMTSEGGTQSFEIKSNAEWSIIGYAEWCELSATKGEGDAIIEVTVGANEMAQSREVKYIFNAGIAKDTLIIKQNGAEYLSLSSDTLIFDCEGKMSVIDVSASGKWSVEGMTDWCTIDKISGEGDGEVNVTTLLNEGADRTTTLVFTMPLENPMDGQSSISVKVEVIQKERVFEFNEVEIGGLIWMDRNLGAKSVDYENEWYQCVGNYYQWGRNIPFKDTTTIEVVEGPLALDQIAINSSDEGVKGFVTVSEIPYIWSTEKDDNLWKDNNGPCPKGWRVPTYKDFLAIAPSNWDAGSWYAEAMVIEEDGNSTHYLGYDDWPNKGLWGIKKQGTDKAYYLRWELKNLADPDSYDDLRVLEISVWDATAGASFYNDEAATEPKTREEIKALFAELGEPKGTLSFLAATCRSCSSGSLGWGMGSDGQYWISDFDPESTDGNLTYCFNFGTLSTEIGSDYRAFGCPVRAVRDK